MTHPDYKLLNAQVRALIADEPDALAAAANFVGLLFHAFEDVNWLGLYVLRGDELVLGPFQGQPACVHIAMGAGVCGTAAATGRTQRVADVHEFPDHIVCDAASRSEIVVPLIIDDEIVGVLDIDSPSVDRFNEEDQRGIEELCRTYCGLQAARAGFI
jgi:L-methionine (R)-S-oxide reductase